jgi:hypothetical protein
MVAEARIPAVAGLIARRLAEDIDERPAPINAMLAGLLAVEAAALRIADMPIGSSLLAVARKPPADD